MRLATDDGTREIRAKPMILAKRSASIVRRAVSLADHRRHFF